MKSPKQDFFLKIGMNGPRGLATPMAKVCAGISEGKMDLRRICAICAVCAFQVDPERPAFSEHVLPNILGMPPLGINLLISTDPK